MRFARWGPLLVAGFSFVWISRGEEAPERSAVRPAMVAGERDSGFRGAGSCSATACHGSITRADRGLSRVRRNEHTTWISDDVHSRAYQVLFNDQSVRIVANLAGGKPGHTPAHEDARCLACHSTPRSSSALKATAWMNGDGVGCESCHGAAGQWLGQHTTLGWEGLTPAQKADQGMMDLSSLASRARLCLGCHVGEHSQDGLVRDVNHDLIGAGHPRLNFELAAFLDNMPAHWDESSPLNAGPYGPNGRAADFPARAWAFGRLATLKASLELLKARAAKAHGPTEQPGDRVNAPEPLPGLAGGPDKTPTPWPEFTEYGCFSCHHDLRDEAWRRGARDAGIRAGALRWGTWALPQTKDLMEQLLPAADAKAFEGALGPLTAKMAGLDSDPRAVEGEAREAARSLGRALDSLATKRFHADDVRRLIDRYQRPGVDRPLGWDEAAQLYLALVPLRQAWIALAPERKAEQDQLEARLEELRRRLAFPDGFDSPRRFDPARLPVGR